jgi:hypothetical protein
MSTWVQVNALVVESDGRAAMLARGVEAPLVVLSQNCEMDKRGSKVPVLVAPVRPLTDLAKEQDRQTVRDGRRNAFLYLPEVGGRPESFCDLRATTYLQRPVIEGLTRIASMDDAGLTTLARQLIIFLTRIDLAALGGAN